ncbi:MFS transporter [Cellulosimicrobium protaetiae]|uniref:MFS transporter n=1 Tax=Cellulosimicrobium protaetiae TaxID=2587808 RepID=A0A6M5UJR6_9MICO|nr:MFS transporter [Cellulosimicrobium protaetiae]QJW37461.1 MFS transporter [Cellulosimicrobium protaetiae]
MTERIATTAAYAVQGFGFAVVLTSIPGYKDRLGMGDDVVTLVVLGVCVLAGLGSALSGVVAAVRGARAVVVGGLLLAALAVAGIGLAPSWPAFFVAIGLYGLALGAVDAAMNMLGIDVERAHGRSLLASFYAANAAGGVLGALAVSGSALVALGQPVALPLVALLVAAGAVLLALRLPDGGSAARAAAHPGAAASGAAASAAELPSGERPGPEPAGPTDDARRLALPGTAWVAGGTIALLGAGMLAFPVADSAVSSWSATFLRDVLAASAVAAPLGYAAYQAALIVSRLVGDGLVERLGRVRVVRLGGTLGALGFVAVAVAPAWPVAVLGLAATGLGLGVVAPLAFSAIGDRAREAVAAVSVGAEAAASGGRVEDAVGDGVVEDVLVDAETGAAPVEPPAVVVATVTDRAVARLNVFTYAGAVLGGVLTGVFATAHHLRLGFVVLAVLAAVSAVLAGAFRPARVAPLSVSETTPPA